MRWPILLLFSLVLGLVAAQKNKTECFRCQDGARCTSACLGNYCLKTVHLQTGQVKRDCIDHLSVDIQMGTCKTVTSEVGSQDELICVCDSHRCNSSNGFKMTYLSFLLLIFTYLMC
ncbi:unnamed protein product [Bursaphelenchus okinawaensis]|uniref:Uncharacterized protein n=1 Tax=Bursaphelenchus okinawaensis TaxID=465554 RepID=A0A811LNZ0_9BILA|nr:unnamed protein product [Bursaphelenchus okinawaensis]CAG9126739.1 unnamed protein product [Bursaphelenchus okinawaensis]